MQGVKRIIMTLFLAVLSFGAGAHPHSFIHLKTEVVSENDRFVALKCAGRWMKSRRRICFTTRGC